MAIEAKKRLDIALVELGLAKSRTQAQQYIDAKAVRLDGKIIQKSSTEILFTPDLLRRLSIQSENLNSYVSRGGLKLEAALKHTEVIVQNKVALDIGISTGGFSDCLLRHGATRVVGVDVGQGQLDPKLKNDERISSFEKINARNLSPQVLGESFPAKGFDLIVIDVSFISLELILPPAKALLHLSGHIVALVKPQFEAGQAYLGKGGIIKDPKAFEEVQKKIYKISEHLQLKLEDYFESSITGMDGNKEFFAWLHHPNFTP